MEELCVNYLKNVQISKKVVQIVSRRGVGEVLGALGAPLGTQGGPKSGF